MNHVGPPPDNEPWRRYPAYPPFGARIPAPSVPPAFTAAEEAAFLDALEEDDGELFGGRA